MEMKRCSRCGIEKPVDSFRHYYGGRKGIYKFCKDCDRVEQRRRYLYSRASKLTVSQQKELDAIEELYTKRRELGLDVPTYRESRGTPSTLEIVRTELSKYSLTEE